jgi:hypothetical protein
VRRGLLALAALYLLAHLALLPPTFDDIDAINFGLGVRDFDVAQHQPHPPGYPLFIAAGKIATPLLAATHVAAPDVRGLAVWSALAGAVLVVLIFALWRQLDGDVWHAGIATAIAVCSPLFWFTSLRPLSDLSGLCAATGSLLLTLRALPAAWTSGRPPSTRGILGAALLAGLAVGFRSQTVVITAPLLALAVLLPASGIPSRLRVGAIVSGALGVLLWAVPMLVASGGLGNYLAALGNQAGEDFSGVVMVWTNRSVRVAILAVLNTFVLPWDSPVLAGIVLALAAGGVLVLALRAPRRVLLLATMFGPYAVFHLVFQETVTVRYALPLVIPIAYFVTGTLLEAGRMAGGITAAALVAVSLGLAVPASVAYARSSSPVFQALDAVRSQSTPEALVAMHRRILTESRRARRWAGDPAGHLLPAPRDYEWLELTRAWREHAASPGFFFADPRRTDTAMIDPSSQQVARYRWPFRGQTYVGGARPDQIDVIVMKQPGWFLEEGWALTPEVAGVTERQGWGPYLRPSVGWIRRRSGETMMMLGGRHLGAPSDPPARIVVSLDQRVLRTFEVTPGFFLRFDAVPTAALDGSGPFAQISIQVQAAAGGAAPRVAIEQFDLQDPDRVLLGFDQGWQEPEYNPQTGRSWRWMSEQAALAIHSGGHDVHLRIEGESSRRYFPRTSIVRLMAGQEEIGRLEPTRDFVWDVTVPASALAASGGKVLLTADQMFVPGDRDGSADRRHLAVRIYSIVGSAR